MSTVCDFQDMFTAISVSLMTMGNAAISLLWRIIAVFGLSEAADFVFE